MRLHRDVLESLGGDAWTPLQLVGRRTTAALAAIAPPGLAADRGLLLCDDLVLGNLGVRSGTPVEVSVHAARIAASITVAGPPEIVAAVEPELLRLALLGKVVTAGDNVSLLPQDFSLPLGVSGADLAAARRSLATTVGSAWTSVLLTVVDAAPDGGPAIVSMGTTVGWQGGRTTSGSSVADAPATAGPVTHVADLPGLQTQAAALREWLDLGFSGGALLQRLGVRPSMGVLVTGPAGSGKGELVRAVADRLGAPVLRLWAPSLVALDVDAAATSLRRTVRDATSTPRAVVLVEDVDALVPRDAPASPLATVFLELVRETVAGGRAAVVCTTARPESVAVALRAPGALDHEIAIPLPDAATRQALLDVLTRGMPLAPDVRLDDVAARTPAFVRADLLALSREAGLRAALRQRDGDHARALVTAADFEAALEVVRPTAMADSTLDTGGLTLDDVGDMAEVKAALTETVLWPLSYPDTFDRLGVEPPHGLLLYGPPGTGKTFVVRALAGTGQANMLAVKGAELLTKWVGESERAVRELFRRARDAAPTIVFLDEVDALAPPRGRSTDGGTTDRVVAALLTELDGVEQLRDVVVIGATNRPDLIDPALLRPGRLERLVYVPPPDAEARAAILRAAGRNVPFAADVDLDALARVIERFSAADCAALVRESALSAMRESLSSPAVTNAHIEQALTRVRPSLDPAQVAYLEQFAAEQARR